MNRLRIVAIVFGSCVMTLGACLAFADGVPLVCHQYTQACACNCGSNPCLKLTCQPATKVTCNEGPAKRFTQFPENVQNWEVCYVDSSRPETDFCGEDADLCATRSYYTDDDCSMPCTNPIGLVKACRADLWTVTCE